MSVYEQVSRAWTAFSRCTVSQVRHLIKIALINMLARLGSTVLAVNSACISDRHSCGGPCSTTRSSVSRWLQELLIVQISDLSLRPSMACGVITIVSLVCNQLIDLLPSGVTAVQVTMNNY